MPFDVAAGGWFVFTHCLLIILILNDDTGGEESSTKSSWSVIPEPKYEIEPLRLLGCLLEMLPAWRLIVSLFSSLFASCFFYPPLRLFASQKKKNRPQKENSWSSIFVGQT